MVHSQRKAHHRRSLTGQHYSQSADDTGCLVDILRKIIHGQEEPDFWFQLLPGFESEYVEVYRGLGGLSPKSHRSWRTIRPGA